MIQHKYVNLSSFNEVDISKLKNTLKRLLETIHGNFSPLNHFFILHDFGKLQITLHDGSDFLFQRESKNREEDSAPIFESIRE